MSEPAAIPVSSPSRPPRSWRFGAFLLDEQERRLTVEGRSVALSPRAFDLLVLLVERHGRLARREELIALLWPDCFVEDGTLARHVSDLRKALGSAAGQLETVPKAGYRFMASVEELAPPAPPAPPRPEPSAAPGPRAGHRWRGAGLALALLVLATLGWWRVGGRSPGEAAPLASLAVLPFTPIGEGRDTEHLELGIADVLITHLSQLSDFEVRPLGAVSRYVGISSDPLAAGRSLRVDAVLEGTLRLRDGRLRVSARLLAVADGRSLWAGSFDHSDRDLLTVEEAIAREALLALSPSLRPVAAGEEVARPPLDPEAHDLYLRGRFFWAKRTSAGNQRAVELFDAALARTPDYAEAEAGLAAAYALLAGLAHPPELYERARQHAERALRLDPRSADACAVLALVAENYDGDWLRAEAEYQRALALQPNHPTAHHWYGEMLALLGRFDQGLALLERAARLDPLSLAIATDIAKAHYFARHWDDAVRAGEEVLTMDSQFAWAWAWVGAAELERGNPERSLDCLTRFDQLEASPFSAAVRIWALVATGRLEEAQAQHQRLERAAREGYVIPVALAMARLARGDEEGALDALDQLVATRQNRVGVSTSPLFARLRDHLRYRDLLQRAGLASPDPPPR